MFKMKCKGLTDKGARCKHNALHGFAYCPHHIGKIRREWCPDFKNGLCMDLNDKCIYPDCDFQ